MTPDAASLPGGTLFDTDFLRRLELLRFVSKQVQPGQIRGEHRAKRRGSGLQFADYRPYVVGDDTRDLGMMAAAGLKVAVADAHPDVIREADWVTRAAGGRGAVREVCDALIGE